MPKDFTKTKLYGCVVVGYVCNIINTDKGKMYLIGRHTYISMCNKYNELELNDEDTLYDMFQGMIYL